MPTTTAFNAASPSIGYPLTEAEVLNAVNTALLHGTDKVLKDNTALLKEANEIKCP